MKRVTLALLGFGNVGRAFVRLLAEKREEMLEKHALEFSITGICTGSHGSLIDETVLDGLKAAALIENGMSFQPLQSAPSARDALDFIRLCPADVLLENSPVNYADGQPAVSHARAALEKGMHVVTANKGPVVHNYLELSALAQKHKKRFLFESAVMDGAPIFSLFRNSLPAARVLSFEGILNSCTNLMLGRMQQGETLEQAVQYAQSIGIAETDPSGDVDGWDAAVKVSALVSVLMDSPLTPQQVQRTGIRDITRQQLLDAETRGERIKLVCRASRGAGWISASVAPEPVKPDSPLYSVNGTSSFVTFRTDCLPGLGILESDPGPRTTAYGLLADLLEIYA